MNITSAQFLKGIIGPDTILDNNFSQVAFVGRSNAGKSTLINSLTKQKKLARTSNTPGRTQEINIYIINNHTYFLDLPGYGYAAASKLTQVELQKIIQGYLFESSYVQKKVVVVIDSVIGPTALDLEMLDALEKHKKEILIVANKIDKLNQSERKKQLDIIQEKIGCHTVIPYSSEKNIGRSELICEIL